MLVAETSRNYLFHVGSRKTMRRKRKLEPPDPNSKVIKERDRKRHRVDKICESIEQMEIETNPPPTFSSTEPPPLQIFIKTMSGKTVTVCCHLNSTIAYLKEVIEDKEGIPWAGQRLLWAGKELQNSYFATAWD